MSDTHARLLPRLWVFTVADLTKLCGEPVDAAAVNASRGGDPVLVDDVEGMCRGAMADAQRRGSLARDIETGDWLEVLGFLFGQVPVRATNFNPAKVGIEFRPWLYDHLRYHDVPEGCRWLYGRQGQHRVPEIRNVGTERLREEGIVDRDERTERNREGGMLDDGAGFRYRSRGAPEDPADDWVASFSGLHAGDDRDSDGDLGDAGREARRGAPSGDRHAGAPAGGRAAGRGGGEGRYFRDCLSCGWRTFAQAPNGKPGWHLPDSCSGCGAPFAVAA